MSDPYKTGMFKTNPYAKKETTPRKCSSSIRWQV